jgi:hypothetical protein
MPEGAKETDDVARAAGVVDRDRRASSTREFSITTSTLVGRSVSSAVGSRSGDITIRPSTSPRTACTTARISSRSECEPERSR